jgi:hypothetical protein
MMMHSVPTAALLLLCAASQLQAQGSSNMTLFANVAGTPCATGDVWGHGRNHVLLAQRSRGFAVVDVRDPGNPVVQHIHPPTYPRADIRSYGVGDIKSDGRYIYASNEDFYQGNPGGLFIYDAFPDPMNPTLVANFSPNELRNGVHNLWVEQDTLYAVSDTTGLIEVYDIIVRASPVRIATLGTGISGAQAHDVMVKNGLAYCSFLTRGFAIYDVTTPAAQQNWTNSFCHTAWPTQDGNHLYTTDENSPGGVGGAVRIWDISNYGSITQVGTYKVGDPASIVHNAMVVDDLLFVTYYKEGVRVCSIKNPAAPVEIAHYDTFPASQTPCFVDSRFAGCWGVWPHNQDVMAVSDLDNGLFLLNLQPVTQTLSHTGNPLAAGQPANVTLTYTNQSTAVLDIGAALIATRLGPIPIYSVVGVDFAPLPPGTTRQLLFQQVVPQGLPPGLAIEFTGQSGLLGPNHLILSNLDVAPLVLQ